MTNDPSPCGNEDCSFGAPCPSCKAEALDEMDKAETHADQEESA